MREIFLKTDEQSLLIRISTKELRQTQAQEIAKRLLIIGLIRRTSDGVWVTTDEGDRWLISHGY